MAHREDAALHRLLLAGLGVRSTAERVSFCLPCCWWARGPLLTDLLVASVASDIYVLLNGTEQAAAIARDALRQALECPPEQLQAQDGLITNALSFLAACRFPLTDSFRVCLTTSTPRPHALVGPFSQTKFEAAARFCRVGVLANSLRLAYRVLLPRFGIEGLRDVQPPCTRPCLGRGLLCCCICCAVGAGLGYRVPSLPGCAAARPY